MISMLAPGCSIITHFRNNPGTNRALRFRKRGCILHSVPSNVFRKGGMGVVNGNIMLSPTLFGTRTRTLRTSKRPLGRHLRVSGGTRLVLPARHVLSTTCRTTGKSTGIKAANGKVNPACASGMDHGNIHMNSVLRGFSRGCTTTGTHRRRVLGDLGCRCSLTRLRGT